MLFTNGFVNFKDALQKIIRKQQQKDLPDWLKEFSVFDCLPGCKWSGGRYVKEFYSDFDLGTVTEMNDLGIGCFFVLTNLEYKNLEDPSLHAALKRLSECDKNGVIIANNDLYDLVKKEYPVLKTSKSIIGMPSTEKKLLEEIEKYDYVCLRQKEYYNHEFMRKVNKEKCEVLLNNACAADCPYYRKHYKLVSLALTKPYDPKYEIVNRMCFYEKRSLIFGPQDFIDWGYTTYKFSMRAFGKGVQICSIEHYLKQLEDCFRKSPLYR